MSTIFYNIDPKYDDKVCQELVNDIADQESTILISMYDSYHDFFKK